MRAARKLRRFGCLLATGVALAVLGALVVPQVGEARAGSVSAESVSASSVAPVAIDIPGLFGDENEPDENEGGGEQGKQNSGTSLPVVILLVLIAAMAGGYVAIRVRRTWLRLRGWGRDMRSRARL